MPNFKSISKSSHYTKLLVGDKMHIANMVKEFKMSDKRFGDMSSAIRYYVHVGIAAETATSDIRHSLDNTIVKASQKEAVRNELEPLKNSIKALIKMVEETDAENRSIFNDIKIGTDRIESKLDNNNEVTNDQSKTVASLLNNLLTTGEHSLRNMIVLRSIIYVFLLGHKTGNIEPGKENEIKWSRLIKLAHSKANELSLSEIKMLSNEKLEADTIQRMASEIFREIS